MSTEIKEFKGKHFSGITQEFENCTLHLNRFAGGHELNGSALQLTICGNKSGYICLTRKQTVELARTLLNSFDREIHPSE
jgi:hypothetical protein